MSTTKLTKELAIEIMEATGRYEYENEHPEGMFIFWDKIREEDFKLWYEETNLNTLILLIVNKAFAEGERSGNRMIEALKEGSQKRNTKKNPPANKKASPPPPTKPQKKR